MFIAASADAGRMHDCTRVYRNYKLRLWGLPDLGQIRWTTRFCWSKYKKRAVYASGSMGMDPQIAPGWELSGYKGEPGQKFEEPFEWNGGSHGGTRMWQNFDITICTPLIKLACATEERGEVVHRGRWDGSHYGVIRNR